MDLSASVRLTPKGEDEVKHRTNRLSVRKRSLLLLLDKPQTLEYLFKKTVLHQEEADAEVQSLLREGFIAVGDGAGFTAPGPAAAKPPPAPPAPGAAFRLKDDIVVSEAKFLLIDFCVDSFGTNSEAFCNDVRACHSVAAVAASLGAIVAAAEKQCPQRLPALARLVEEINATAD